MDECGVSRLPSWVRTWAKRGQTPELVTGDERGRVSVIAALSVEGQLWYDYKQGSYQCKHVAEFVESLLEEIPQPLTLIWDGAQIHFGEEMKVLCEVYGKKLWLVRQPAYSPEVNPVEHVWKELKYAPELRNRTCRSLTEVEVLIDQQMAALQSQTTLLLNLIRDEKVAFF